MNNGDNYSLKTLVIKNQYKLVQNMLLNTYTCTHLIGWKSIAKQTRVTLVNRGKFDTYNSICKYAIFLLFLEI